MQNETYELFYHPWSPPSRTCKTFLDTLGIPHKLTTLDMEKNKEHKSKDHKSKNTLGKVPVLGVFRPGRKPLYIFESFAILKYLSHRFQNELYDTSDK